MCKRCGNCSKEHERTIDDSIDFVLDSLYVKIGE
jgi:hypothetical protein